MAEGTELAKAYVQIIPSAQGIKGKISEALGGEAESGGKSAGLKIVNGIKGAIAAAGIGTAIKEALDQGAALQQSIGGVETLFKESADVVRQYADQAYQTAGLSANAYMEQVTSFSASLLQSLDGDTRHAAEAANQAVIDMSDNANKMGTDIASIQNAYQGFAKKNYTMLDNLKLGYGGTKEEMERLLADAEKLSGVHYDISNLNDVYSAIHVIQGELGITGTTAEEAASTFTGSFAAMKASVQNVLASLTLGEDITPALEGLVESTRTFLVDNLAPMLMNIVQGLLNNLPAVVEAGLDIVVALATGIADNIDELIPSIVSCVLEIVEILTEPETMEKLVGAAAQIIAGIAQGLIEALPVLIEKVPEIILNVVQTLIECIPMLIDAVFHIFDAIGEAIADLIKNAGTWGKDLIDNFVQGIRDRIQHVIDTIRGVAEDIKGLIGFSEPEEGPLSNFHTYAPDMMELFAEGIRGNAHLVTDSIDDAFDVGTQIVNVASEGAGASILPRNDTGEGGNTASGNLPPINVTLTFTGSDQSIVRSLGPKLEASWALRGKTM